MTSRSNDVIAGALRDVPQRQPPSPNAGHALARSLVLRHGWNTLASQILNPGIRHWFLPGGEGVVGYVAVGGAWVAAGAPICPPARLAATAEVFEAAAAREGRRVCYIGAQDRLAVEPETLVVPEDRWVFVARRDSVVIAYLVATPIPQREGWLLEQVVRGRAAPNGTAELLIDAAMRALAAEGASYVTLGVVPLSQRAPIPEGPQNALVRSLLAWVRAHSRRFYNFEGLEAFKAAVTSAPTAAPCAYSARSLPASPAPSGAASATPPSSSPFRPTSPPLPTSPSPPGSTSSPTSLPAT